MFVLSIKRPDDGRVFAVDLDALRIDTGELARNLSREDLYVELCDMAVRDISRTCGKQTLLIALAFHRLQVNSLQTASRGRRNAREGAAQGTLKCETPRCERGASE